MKADLRTSFRVGILVAASLTILAVGILTLGQQTNLFSAKVLYLTEFWTVAGLDEGSDVRLAGYRIGHISDIRLPEEVESVEPRVIVELAIEKKSIQWIRGGTRASVKSLGMLGDKYIDLTQGNRQMPVLEPGSLIVADQPIDTDRLLGRGEDISTNLLRFSSSLAKIGERVERGEGLLGEFVQGTPRARQFMDNLAAMMEAIADLFRGFQTNEGGALGVLLGNDARSAETLENMRRLLANLSVLSDKLNQGEGLLGRAITDPEYGDEFMVNITEATRDLRSFASDLKGGEGVVGRLVKDKAYADKLLDDLSRTAASVEQVTAKVAEGDGTVGKLLVDETLYQGLNDILAGAHKSRLTRWILLRSQKAGASERLEHESPEPVAPTQP